MKKKKILNLLVFFLSFYSSAFSQTYMKMGSNNNSQQDFNYSVCQSNNLSYRAGTMMNLSTGNLDISVTCRNQLGIIIWNKTYDFNGNNDFCGKIRAVPNGVIITGATGGLFDNFKQVFALRLDNSGNITNEALYTPPTGSAGIPNTYGLDVVYEPTDNTFVLVGMGDYPDPTTDEYEKRFGWVMKVSPDLQTIIWSNNYTTDPNAVGSWYDCMNDIERIITPANTVNYYITGSLSHYDGSSFVQMQSVLNMLIDINGSIVWDAPFRETNPSMAWLGRQYARGTNALYQDATSNLYLLYHSSWGHSCFIAKVDFATGSVTNNTWFLPLGYTEQVEFNMRWSDLSQTNVTMAGLLPTGNTYLFNANPNTLATTYPNWQKSYSPNFNMADLIAINYDWATKPMTFFGAHMQYFFAPNMFENNYAVDPYYPYCTIASVLEQHSGSGIFNNLDMQTTNAGSVNDLCFTNSSLYQSAAYTSYTVPQGQYSPYLFQLSNWPVLPANPNRINASACGGLKPASVNSVNNKKELNISPNPAIDNLYVNGLSDAEITFSIEDITGRELKNGVITNQKNAIDIADLTPGVYILNINNQDNYQKIKFVKQ